MTRIISQLEEGDRIRKGEEEATLIFRFNADRKAKNKYVEQAIRHIREHYREDINISTVAEQLQISEGYLSRVFKKRNRLHIYHLSFLLPHESGNGTVKRGKIEGI